MGPVSKSFSSAAMVAIGALLVTTPLTAVLFRWSRLDKSPDELYSPSELNLVAELLKLVASAVMLFFFTGQGDSGVVQKPGLLQPKNWLLCLIPSFLYFVQNIVYVVAMGFFPSSLFIAVANTRILFTALFSKVLLGAAFSFDSLMYLVLLTSGVGVASTAKSATACEKGEAEELLDTEVAAFHLGLLLATLTALCSGLAGAYTQKFLQVTFNSVWEANLVMGCTSALFSVISTFAMAAPGTSPVAVGAFHNWTAVCWAAALLQAGHGILSAFAIKLTSSVIKSVIGASAIIVTSFVDTTIFHDSLTITMVLGEVVIACTAVGYIRCQSLVPTIQPSLLLKNGGGSSKSGLKQQPELVASLSIDAEEAEDTSRLLGNNADAAEKGQKNGGAGAAAPFDGRSPRSAKAMFSAAPGCRASAFVAVSAAVGLLLVGGVMGGSAAFLLLPEDGSAGGQGARRHLEAVLAGVALG